MQAPPGVDSDTSGESVSSVEDTAPKPKVYRTFNWRHFHLPSDPAPAPARSASDGAMSGGQEKAKGRDKRKGAKEVMKKTVKFLMEGPDMGDVEKKPDGAQKDEGQGGASDARMADDTSKAPTSSTAANEKSSAMLAMLRSFVAQDMVEHRNRDLSHAKSGVTVDPHRSPLGVPLSRRKKSSSTTASPAQSEPASPSTPTSQAEGSATMMMNPFSTTTSPIMPDGQGQLPFYGYGYGYGWPPYPMPMSPGQLPGTGQETSQAQGQAQGQGHIAPHGYMPPPFYPHPAMLQPWHPGQPPQSPQGGQGIESPIPSQGYLPPHLMNQLNTLRQNGSRRSVSASARGVEDVPVRISRSRSSSRRGPDVAEEGEGGDAAVLPEVPPRDVARSEEKGKKQGTDKQWTKIFICLATSLDIIWRLCQAHQHKHGDESMPKLCASLAKQIGAKRSISQAVVEVFGDEDMGNELSKNLKMGISYIARSEMLKRDPDKLQALIVAFMPKTDSSLGSWLNPKIAQVLVITVQKWIDKQLDVGTALQATRTVQDEARRSGVPEGATTSVLDQMANSLREQISAPEGRPTAERPREQPVQPAANTASSARSRHPSTTSGSAGTLDPTQRERTANERARPTHPDRPKPQPVGLLEQTRRGVIQPVDATSPRKPSRASTTTSKPSSKRVPAPIAVPHKAATPPKAAATPIASASPATMSSSSRYSTDDVTSAFPSTAVATAPSTSTSSLIPLDSPGTVESDAEADGLLSMADSGPAAVHVDRGTELLEKEEEERKKRKHHKPSKEEVREAKALLAEK